MGIVRSDLLPAEYAQVTGSVAVADLTTAPLDDYSQFAECILWADATAKNHLITTDTIIYDVRLELGIYAGIFRPSSTVFAANSLCSDQAIRLCWNPDSQQSLLRCTTGGQEQCFLLRKLTDGSFLWQPMSAE